MDKEPMDKRSAILAAALDLISEQGFQNSPMSQVALHANTGVGTIYRYFSGKDALVNALYLDVKKRMTQCMMRGTEGMTPVKAFKLAARNMVDFFVENPKALSFCEQYLNSPLITAETREEVSRVTEPMKNWFEEALRQDLLKAMPVELMGDLIYSAVVALAKYSLTAGEDGSGLAQGIDAIWDMVRQ